VHGAAITSKIMELHTALWERKQVNQILQTTLNVESNSKCNGNQFNSSKIKLVSRQGGHDFHITPNIDMSVHWNQKLWDSIPNDKSLTCHSFMNTRRYVIECQVNKTVLRTQWEWRACTKYEITFPIFCTILQCVRTQVAMTTNYM
jgi:hypothetical protein